jgi:putative phage-type endonuclease
MALQRISYPDRASWLAGRAERGVGASEAAAVCGMSKWMTKNELWEIHTGRRERKDISGKDYVGRGHLMEAAVRGFYAALHPEYGIEYHPYDILYQEERPWLFATLDGQITSSDGRNGILEIKTSAPNSREAWREWDGQIPQAYYCQCIHQLLATGWDFVVLQPALWHMNGDITLKDAFVIERSEHEADLAWLLQQEEEFWESVQTGKRPGAPIRF